MKNWRDRANLKHSCMIENSMADYWKLIALRGIRVRVSAEEVTDSGNLDNCLDRFEGEGWVKEYLDSQLVG